MQIISVSLLTLAALSAAAPVRAQSVSLVADASESVASSPASDLSNTASTVTSTSTSAPLPDSPGSTTASSAASASASSFRDSPPQGPASPTAMVVLPGQQAPRMTVNNKIVAGIKDSISPFSIFAWILDAGYEQLLTASPNYELTTPGIGGQFGKRLGAGALRDITEETFGVSILAPLLHEDPRYYKLGKSHSFGARLVYAGTRALITKTDNGHLTPNIQSLGGNLAGSYLTKAYYPDFNTTNSEVLKTFGGSVGGTALGYVVTEFLPNFLQFIHLQPAPPAP